MESLSLARLALDLDLTPPHGSEAVTLTGVSTDTRTLRPGEVFFALSGENHDGARFVLEAFRRGARAAVAPIHTPDPGQGRPVLRVRDTVEALLRFAGAYRARLGFQVVAVTGSAGKTTTKELVWHLAAAERRAVRSQKSFNNHVGVPLTLLSADAGTEVAVVEVGTSSPGEIARLAAVARPDVAVITCVGAAHLEGLGGLEGVAKEKLSLLEALGPRGVAVLNGDDPRLRAGGERFARERGRASVLLCGLGAAVELGGQIEREAHERRLRVSDARALPLRVPGRAFAQDVLLALGAARALGLSPVSAAAALRGFAPPPGRMHLIEVGGVTLVDDSYNANPTSVGASLEALSDLAEPEERLVVLGGMKELGAGGAELHRDIGRRVAELGAALLVAVGPEAREIALGAAEAGLAPACIRAVDQPREAVDALAGELRPGRAVLFKASRACRLEEAWAAVRERLLTAGARRAA